MTGKQDENHGSRDGRHDTWATQPRGRAHHIGPRRGGVIHEPSGHVSIDAVDPLPANARSSRRPRPTTTPSDTHKRSDDWDR